MPFIWKQNNHILQKSRLHCLHIHDRYMCPVFSYQWFAEPLQDILKFRLDKKQTYPNFSSSLCVLKSS